MVITQASNYTHPMTASRRPSPMLIRSPGSLYSRGVACEQAVLKIQRIWSLRSAEVKNDLCIIFWYWNTVRYHVDLVYAIKSAKHKNMWLVKISNRKHREIRPFCCHPTLEVPQLLCSGTFSRQNTPRWYEIQPPITCLHCGSCYVPAMNAFLKATFLSFCSLWARELL